MYDVFTFTADGVTVQLEALAWTNDTTRATALVRQNGVWVKTGALDRRFVGCYRTTTVSGQCEDSENKRFLWNTDNRVLRAVKLVVGAGSWTYSSGAKRQWNAAAGNMIQFINGLIEESILVTCSLDMTIAAGVYYVGLALNATNVFHDLGCIAGISVNGTTLTCVLNQLLSPGYSYVAGVERGDAVNTATLNAGSNVVKGIVGQLNC